VGFCETSAPAKIRRAHLALLIYHGFRNYRLAEQEFLARRDVLSREPAERGAILMQSKSFNDVEAQR